ncbi:glycerophosphodiester phosphodiesterase, partial [Xanthomonas citri pv. citri]|nr:glycerophosphodiester phosphodiesterase [Xanthomonas citri pv. citri]
ELKTLRAKERLPQVRPESASYDGRYQVPTFEEVLELRERLSTRHGRQIGVIPEIKHPTYFDSIGLSMEERVVELLDE